MRLVAETKHRHDVFNRRPFRNEMLRGQISGSQPARASDSCLRNATDRDFNR